jgi:competence protein ComEA
MAAHDPDATPAARLLAALGRLGVTPSEVVALLLLAAAAVAGLGILWWASGPSAEPTGIARSPGQSEQPGGDLDVRAGTVVVHVAGRVRAPGLYELPGGSRVADALEAAGGPLGDALLDHLNLARPIADGEQLRVQGPDDLAAPAGGEAAAGAAQGSAAWRPDGRLDLNLATERDLEELPGIGPVLAGRIVAFREERGRFASVGELRQVTGIGERTFQALAELVAV